MSAPLATIGMWIVSLLATETALAPIDYAADADAWNGLGYLETTAAEARVQLRRVATLDLGRLVSGDVLLWVFPSAAVGAVGADDADAFARRARIDEVEEMLAFVQDGGRLILADDFGSSAELLRRLGIERHDASPPGQLHRQGSAGDLPVVRPARDHFLFFNVDELVANHPAFFTGAGDPILTFDDPSQRLVVERAWGSGRLLAIADPSLLLNQMLRRFYGNKQFAANVLRYFCDVDPCTVELLGPDTVLRGHYRPGLGRLGHLARLFEQGGAATDAALARTSSLLAEPPLSGIVAALLALLALVGLGATLAVHRRPEQRPSLAGEPAPLPPALIEAGGLAASSSDADFTGLALTLVEQIQGLRRGGALATVESWAADDPRHSDPEAEGARVARRALLRIEREAASLRGRTPVVIGADRFVRLFHDVLAVERHLDGHSATARRRAATALAARLATSQSAHPGKPSTGPENPRDAISRPH